MFEAIDKKAYMEEILSKEPYDLPKMEKDSYFYDKIMRLTNYHDQFCESYHRLLPIARKIAGNGQGIESLPFLPVRLFKEEELRSIPKQEIFKVMTSSGTSGQAVSKIYLDKITSVMTQKALVKIVTNYTQEERLPMLIIDSSNVVKDRNMFSARGAGILGFSIFGHRPVYALDHQMSLDLEAVKDFAKTYQGKRVFLFGFTFMIWEHFYKALIRENIKLDLSKAVMIHGGGWKKMEEESVDEESFKQGLKDVCKIQEIYDYYGMVEQTGCIYMECQYGHLHVSNYSDIIVRRPKDFSPCDIGEEGILQVLSLLPLSYPGHSLLTEDRGILLGQDDCPCGRLGKYFRIKGRMQDAEIRGCSDTYARH